MIVAIVGSRDGLDFDAVKLGIGAILAREDVGTVVSGGAIGVDRIAETMAITAGKRVHTIRPEWQKYGKRAGFIRNASIVDIADEVYAFWDGKSRGTANTIDIARKARKPVHVVECPK